MSFSPSPAAYPTAPRFELPPGAAATAGAAAAGAASRALAAYPVASRACVTRHEVPPGYVVDTLVVEGPGIRPTRERRYALPEAAALFQAIGRLWAARFPGRRKIHLGDVSQRGGGRIPPHGSHRVGVDADIALPRRDGGMGGTAVGQPSYDQGATRDLLRVIREVAGSRLCYLFFNDPVLIAEGLCQEWRGHHNHIHVRFKLPARPAAATPELGDACPGCGGLREAAQLRAALMVLATRLQVDPLLLRAVVQVESAGSGFGPAGRPLIRVEAHRLLRSPEPLRGRFAARFRVDGPKPWLGHHFRDASGAWQSYHGRQDREWAAFEAASAVDLDAAVRATSWGFGQVMGEWSWLGYPDVRVFVALQRSIAGQVETFGRFLERKPGVLAALRARDLRSFARGYNGPGQMDLYAGRIREAWRRLGGG